MDFAPPLLHAVTISRIGGRGDFVLTGLLDILSADALAPLCVSISGEANIKVLLMSPDDITFKRVAYRLAAIIFVIHSHAV